MHEGNIRMSTFISIKMIHLSLTGPNIPHSNRRQGRMEIALRFSIALSFARFLLEPLFLTLCQRLTRAFKGGGLN